MYQACILGAKSTRVAIDMVDAAVRGGDAAERRSVDVRGATLQGGHLDYVVRWHSAHDELRRAPRTAPQLTTRCIFKRLRLVVCLPDGWRGSDLPIRISWNGPQTVRQRAVSA